MVTSDERIACQQAEQEFSRLLEPSTDGMTSEVRAHLTECDSCRRSYEKFGKLVRVLGELPSPTLSRDLTDEINARIDFEPRARYLDERAYWVAAVLLLIAVLAGAGYWLTGATHIEGATPAEARIPDVPAQDAPALDEVQGATP